MCGKNMLLQPFLTQHLTPSPLFYFRFTQAVREYTGKVDDLLSERKEHLQAKEAAVKEQQQQEAARNAYATLMPLALPAPPSHGGGGSMPDLGGFQGAPAAGFGGPYGGY